MDPVYLQGPRGYNAVTADDGWFPDDLHFPSTSTVGDETDTGLQLPGFRELLDTNSVFDGYTDTGFQPLDLIADTELTGLNNYATPGFDPVAGYNQYVDPGLLSLDFTDQNGLSVFDEPVSAETNSTIGYSNHLDAVHQPSGFIRAHEFGGSDNPASTIASASDTQSSSSIDAGRNTTSPATRLISIRPTSIAAATTPVNSNGVRLACTHPGCTATSARLRDLQRHMKKHSPPQHDCPVNGCDRKGDNAFPRKDKLRDHLRQKHKMAV